MRIAQATHRFGQMVFASFLGVNIVEVAHEHAVLHVPYQVAHSNPDGVLNGGVTASLINLAGTLAAWTGIALDARTLSRYGRFLHTIPLGSHCGRYTRFSIGDTSGARPVFSGRAGIYPG